MGNADHFAHRMAETKDPDFVTALARGLSILACFGPDDIALGNGQIASRTHLAPATVARLTYTLTELGYLRSLPNRHKYALAPQVLRIAYPILAALPEREIARPHLDHLAESSRGSVCLAVMDGPEAVYVEVARGADAALLPDIGTHRHLLRSSIGRALYVGLDEAQRSAVLNQLCLNEPAQADAHRQRAREACDDFERYGMCRTVGAVMSDWSAVAIPLMGLAGRRLAISSGVPTRSVPKDALMRHVGMPLAAAASRIAVALRAMPASAGLP